MMNKNKTARAHLSWFLLLLPVASIVLLSFRSNWPPSPQNTTMAVAPALPLTDTVPKVKEVGVEKKAFKKPAAKKPATEPEVKEVRLRAPKTQPAKTETLEIVPAKKSATEPEVKELRFRAPKAQPAKTESIEIVPAKEKNKAPKEQHKDKQKTEKRVTDAEKQVKQVYTGNVVYTNGNVTMMSDSVVITKTGDAKNGTYQMRADHIRVIPMERKSREAPAPAPKLK